MNGLFYLALERLPLGVTVTIEVLGPLVLSIVASRRASAWLWALLALVGVFALGGGGWGDLDPLGVLFALGAAASWAFYILASARVGREFPKLDGLALAMTRRGAARRCRSGSRMPVPRCCGSTSSPSAPPSPCSRRPSRMRSSSSRCGACRPPRSRS